MTPIPWSPRSEARAAARALTAPKPASQVQEGIESGKFHLSFDRMTTLEDGVYYAEGGVRFEQVDMLLTADAITYDSNLETLVATGQVSVDWGRITVAGTRMTYDLKADTGTVEDAYAVEVGGEFTVIAKVIRKTGADWYEMEDAVLTSCTAAVPPWSMKVARGSFQVDHYAYLRHPRFRARSASFLYLPYLIWPLKPERSTGFLIPNLGSSNQKGFEMNAALYIAPSDWWDDTVYLDYYAKEGFGLGQELRYALSERNYGWFRGYYIRQRSDERRRWTLQWTHLQNLRRGWRVVADINLLSDIDFPGDYQRDYSRATISGTDSKIYLQREWGPYYLNAFVERRLEYFADDRDLTQRVLPQVEWRSSLQPLGAGLYMGWQTSASLLHKEWVAPSVLTVDKSTLSYGRFDAHPFFEWPLHPAPWLDLTPRLEMRATYYSEGVDPETQEEAPGAFWRTYYRTTLDATGPRFYRKFGGGYKHVVEPYIRWTYAGRDSDALKVPIFDEVDTASLNQNLLRFGLANRLYDRAGNLRAEAEIYQDRSFRGPLSRFGERASQLSPVTLLARAWPSRIWSGELRLRYNNLRDSIDSSSFSVTYKPRKEDSEDYLRLTYYRARTLGTSQIQDVTLNPEAQEIRLQTSLTLLKGHVTLMAFLERDMINRRWRQERGIFWYHGTCFSLGLEAGRREIGDFRETTFRFLVRLKNAGTVLDVFGGTGPGL